MPPAQTKSSKTQPRAKPYNAARKPNSRNTTTPQALEPSTTASSSRTSADPLTNADIVAHFSETVPYREVCLDIVARFVPGYTPQNDLEILALASWIDKPRNPTAAQIAACIADAKKDLETEWGVEKTRQLVKSRLEERVQPTGLKPTANTRHVYTRSLPQSEYSIRLFPGQYATRMWAMDIVLTATGEPVNCPFQFGLFAVPNPKTPWLFSPAGQVLSIEASHGYKPNQILPGEEKYFLQDGQTCLLTRPGKRTVQFTVPIRPLPENKDSQEEYDVLDFPEVLSPSDS